MVKKLSIWFTLHFFIVLQVYPAEIRYPVASIDSALLKNASMVVRMRETIVEIQSLNTEILKIHYVVTILKESAADNAIFRVYYDNYISVNIIKGSMYDAAGKLIRNFNNKDISDISAIPDGLMYTDDRVKMIQPVLSSFPVTLEFFSEQRITNILIYPSFEPQDDYEQAVENASLHIIANEGLLPRFKEIRLPESTTISGDEKTFRRWEFHDLQPRLDESLSPSLLQLIPVINLAPVIYNCLGFTGDFSNWNSFGLWMHGLIKDRDSLAPDKTKQVLSLIQGITNPEEMVKIIYKYLQQTTRYVAVGLGIGGLQPEMADKVARLGYSDCKGLVNYASSMLKCAGIPSLIALVSAGENAEPIQPDFPSNQFNHTILCVPLQKDTIWLECTDQNAPFGFLGSFTDNRHALLITQEGGILTRTPYYKKTDNFIVRKTAISVDSAGCALVSWNAGFSGLFFVLMNDLNYLSPEMRDNKLQDRFAVPGLKISSFSGKSEGTRIPLFSESLLINISNYASLNGNRIFIPLTRLLTPVKNYPKEDMRINDLYLRNSYIIYDTMYIRFPAGYHMESKPPDFDLVTPFGSLKSQVVKMNSEFVFIRRFERENGTFPSSSFNGYVEFLKKISTQDNRKLVMVKD